MLVCNQVGTIFSNPRDLTRRGEQCVCGGEVFEEATSGQIQTLGFARDEYV